MYFRGRKICRMLYQQKQFILVVTADDAELLAPALMLEQRGILISGVLLLLGALAAFVLQHGLHVRYQRLQIP